MVVAGAGDMGYGHEGVAEAEAGRIGLGVDNPAADQDLEEHPRSCPLPHPPATTQTKLPTLTLLARPMPFEKP